MEDMNDVQNIETVSEGKQYIVVRIGTEQYGIDIKYVDNIVRNQRITRIPKAQPYFKGVINLRGDIIPVMSLRLKFGLEPDEYTNTTRIIIIKLEPQSAIGIIVDEVKEVVELATEDIDRPAKTTKNDKSSFIFGIGKHGDELISLFDINAVVDESESVS